MTSPPTGGAAFPVVVSLAGTNRVLDGMSLRDWFAGQALSGLSTAGGNLPYLVAEDAYKLADEMMKARKSVG